MTDTQQKMAGDVADKLIAREVAIQDAMWGDANERADSTKNQLIGAALAQTTLVAMKLNGVPSESAVFALTDPPTRIYPEDWNGFRDYGSKVANLVVAAAFIRSEIKRSILLGEDITRTKRGEVYAGPDVPYVSSEEVLASLAK